MTDTYRPRSGTVHARQWNGANTSSVLAWIRELGGTGTWHGATGPDTTGRTRLREHLDVGGEPVMAGDWIVRCGGQWLVFSPRAFAAVYQARDTTQRHRL